MDFLLKITYNGYTLKLNWFKLFKILLLIS